MEGNFNLGAVIATKTISEMDDLWSELLEKYINYFDERLLTIITRAYWFSKYIL